ncbi:UNVERIFIED_CONTAM: hypothetical protein Sangu_1449800 [Sesamum angustifolium]|uniref:Uncharacterized protein n=1 Tax=Sesamum angustifolium TaxID=2727405 RepID=A0AAW2N6X3_9LAMI
MAIGLVFPSLLMWAILLLLLPPPFWITMPGLADASESDEEVSYELPEALLHAVQGEEAPKDLVDQMVEDVFPIKVSLLTSNDEGAALSYC